MLSLDKKYNVYSDRTLKGAKIPPTQASRCGIFADCF